METVLPGTAEPLSSASSRRNSNPSRPSPVQESKDERRAKLATVRATRRQVSQEEREASSKVSLELLAREWLNEQNASYEMRSYLVEKLLPILVMSLEKLLTEVTSKDLVETDEQQEDFNPLNFVAQYLMRNNPRYSNFAETHPYCSSMKQVTEELKKMAYSVEENKLAELKSKSRQRCLVREEAEARKLAEDEKLMELLRNIYGKWLFNGEKNIHVSDVSIRNFYLEIPL